MWLRLRLRLLLVEFLLLYSACHGSHVIMAVGWKTRRRRLLQKVIQSVEEGGIVAQRRRFCCYRPAVGAHQHEEMAIYWRRERRR